MNPIDQLVGERIRTRREALSLSQVRLAEKIGVTFQQLQKYERGINRVAASRLHKISEVLGVKPEFFFDSEPFRGDLSTPDLFQTVLRDVESRRLNTAFRRIDSVRLRRSIIAMIEAVEDQRRETAVSAPGRRSVKS